MQRNEKNVKVSVDLTRKEYGDLQKCVKRSSARSQAEIIRKALKLYKHVQDREAEGQELAFHDTETKAFTVTKLIF